MKLKISTALIALFLIAQPVHAVAIKEVQSDSILSKIVSVLNGCPFHYSCFQERKFGTSITTILGTDTLSASRTTINNNFSALNNGKIENSTTSVQAITTLANLVSVGALSSGSLTTGFTPVTVPIGGTGSSTLSSGQVLLGNGTGNVSVISGWGTSGQFITSNGAGVAPTWQSASVNQTIDYNFTSSYFGVKNLNASSTVANPIKLNTVSYSTPSSQGASSTALTNNGSGALTWNQVGGLLYLNTSPTTITGTAATTTIFSASITGGILKETNVIHGKIPVSKFNWAYGGCPSFDLSYGTASSTIFLPANTQGVINNGGYFEFYLAATSPSGQKLSFSLSVGSTTMSVPATLSQDSTSAKQITLTGASTCTTPTNFVVPDMALIELLPKI